MGGKKKQTSAKKKRQQQQRGNKGGRHQPPPPPSLDEVLTQADAANDAADVETALGLYSYAADVLRRKMMDGTTGAAAAGGAAPGTAAAGGIDDDAILLSRVLGRAGEARVSLGDPEGGREAFLEAIELLRGRGGLDEDENDNDERMDAVGGAAAVAAGPSSSLVDAQLCEVRAGLHLYLGQLSSEREALDSYRSGVRGLERSAKTLEGLVAAASASSSVGGGSKTDGMDEDERPDRASLESMLAETRRQLCGAHCSIADLYMTDLCYDPDAEARCESALASALALDDVDGGGSSSPDALQTQANLRLSQRRGDDAVRAILGAYDRMRVGCEAMADLVGLGRERDDEEEGGAGGGGAKKMDDEEEKAKAKELLEVEAANSLPGFEFRCQTAKILLECAAYLSDDDGDDDYEEQEGEDKVKEDCSGFDCVGDIGGSSRTHRRKSCVEASIQVLGSLLAENDEVVEVWHLLGCAFEASDPPDVDAARHYWEAALAMLAKVKEGMDMDEQQQQGDNNNDGDEDCGGGLDEVEEQMNELREKLAGLGEQKMPPSKDVEMGEG